MVWNADGSWSPGPGLSDVAIDPSGGAGQGVYYKDPQRGEVRPGQQGGYSYGSPSSTNDTSGGTGGAAASIGPPGVDPGSLEIGSDGHLYGYKRTIVADPNVPGKTDYSYVPIDLGNPTDANFDWDAASTATQIPKTVLQSHYQQLQNQLKNQTGQALTLGNFHIMGITTDANGNNVWKLQSNDGREVNIPEDQLLGYQGLTQSDIDTAKAAWMRSKADLTKAGQWTYSSLSNKPGMVLIRNQGTNEIREVPIGDAMDPAKFPGIDTLEVQRAQQTQVEQNWMDAGAFGAPFPQRINQPGGPPDSRGPGAGPGTPGEAPGAPPAAPPGDQGPVLPGSRPGWSVDGTPAETPGGRSGAASGYSWDLMAQNGVPSALPQRQAPATGSGTSALPQSGTGGTATTGAATSSDDDTTMTTQAATTGTVGANLPGTPAGPKPVTTPTKQVGTSDTGTVASTAGATGTGTPGGRNTGLLPQFLAIGSSGGQVPTGWSNQQLELANRGVQNMNNFIRQANTYSKNVSGLGFSGLQRPSVAGWG